MPWLFNKILQERMRRKTPPKDFIRTTFTALVPTWVVAGTPRCTDPAVFQSSSILLPDDKFPVSNMSRRRSKEHKFIQILFLHFIHSYNSLIISGKIKWKI